MIILLTGESGCGKTTLCARVATALQARGVDVAGVLTLPRFVNAEKVGMDVVDIRTGTRTALAERAPRGAGTADLRWKFDEAALAHGARILRAATPCDLLIVDELGPLELVHNQGWIVALDILQAKTYRHALVVVRPHLVQSFCARVNSEIHIETLTVANRDEMFHRIVTSLTTQSPNHLITQFFKED